MSHLLHQHVLGEEQGMCTAISEQGELEGMSLGESLETSLAALGSHPLSQCLLSVLTLLSLPSPQPAGIYLGLCFVLF